MVAKMICVFGSPASGKTICSLAIASKLAEKKKNVIVLNCDRIIPALEMYVPSIKSNTDRITSEKSIGNILSIGFNENENSGDSREALLRKCVQHPKSEYICFMGLAPKENYMSYNMFEKQNVISLYNKLLNLTDYLIIDGSSNPFNDVVTYMGLKKANMIIKTITPDTKGVIFNKSMISMQDIIKSEEENSKNIVILNNIKPISPVDEVISALKTNAKDIITLPYSHEVESKFISGDLISNMSRLKGIEFEKKISKLVGEIVKSFENSK